MGFANRHQSLSADSAQTAPCKAYAGLPDMYCSTIHTHAKKKNRQTPEGFACFLVGEDGFEPSKLEATDLQSAPFGHSGILPYWSWWTDLNPRPADYKSAALPTELHQHSCATTIIIIAQLRGTVKHFFDIFLFSKFQNMKLVFLNQNIADFSYIGI